MWCGGVIAWCVNSPHRTAPHRTTKDLERFLVYLVVQAGPRPLTPQLVQRLAARRQLGRQVSGGHVVLQSTVRVLCTCVVQADSIILVVRAYHEHEHGRNMKDHNPCSVWGRLSSAAVRAYDAPRIHYYTWCIPAFSSEE